MNKSNSKKTLFMVELALMVAIIFVMAFTPLGYFRTPGLSITFLTVPVAVGAIVLGPKGGAVCGLAFGITSLMQCFGGGAFGTMLFSISPAGTVFLCIVPRILEGFLCGLVFLALRGRFKNGAYMAASLACPLLNTLLYMSSLVVIFYNTDYIQGFVQALGVSNPFLFVIAFVGAQGVIEAITCFILASAVSRALGAAGIVAVPQIVR
ncbi:MAG: ECF transporter S component [Clostridiales bacterium]|nr:ECF transporter S component [Clostridiales bacterium]